LELFLCLFHIFVIKNYLIMKKIYFVFLLFFGNYLNAQVATINGSINSTQLNGTGSSAYHVSEFLYTETEIGVGNFTTAGTSIKRINLNVNAVGSPTTQNNIKIYLQNVSSSVTALTATTYSTAGYTEVYSGSITAATQGWIGVNLTTPFVRNAGSNLQMMIERTDNVVPVTALTLWCLNGTNLSRRYNGTAALSGATSLSLSAFRISAQFVNATDLSVVRIETLGKIPTVAAFPHQVKALVQNNGNTTIAAGTQVTLGVSGANTFNNVKTTNALIPGAQQMITFDAINSMVAGTNSVTVSVPADDNLTNNSATFDQNVTNNTFGYPDGSARNSSIGFNTGQGLLVTRHTNAMAINITGIRAYVTTSSNTIFGVVCTKQGVILGQTADYNVVPSDSLTFKSFNFTTPVSIGANDTFFIGIGQRAGAYGYFPLGTQFENPARLNTYASLPLAGGTPSFTVTLGRQIVEAIIEQVLPVTLTSFTGKKEGNNNILSWTTANELNNKGFEIMRSADGRNFSSIGFEASKNNTTTTATSYTFVDEKALVGTNYYQLKQVDKDGKATLSNVVLLKSATRKLEISTVYPNPANDKLNAIISSDKEEKVTVSITDLAGKVVSSQQVSTSNGSTNVFFKLQGLSKGTYLLRLTSTKNNEIQIEKFVKH
jgi:hypothetical protein